MLWFSSDIELFSFIYIHMYIGIHLMREHSELKTMIIIYRNVSWRVSLIFCLNMIILEISVILVFFLRNFIHYLRSCYNVTVAINKLRELRYANATIYFNLFKVIKTRDRCRSQTSNKHLIFNILEDGKIKAFQYCEEQKPEFLKELFCSIRQYFAFALRNIRNNA